MIFSLLLISSLELVQRYEPKSPDSCGRRENLTTEALAMERVEGCGSGHEACRAGANPMWLYGTGGGAQLWDVEQGWGDEECAGGCKPRDVSCALVRGDSQSLSVQGCFKMEEMLFCIPRGMAWMPQKLLVSFLRCGAFDSISYRKQLVRHRQETIKPSISSGESGSSKI